MNLLRCRITSLALLFFVTVQACTQNLTVNYIETLIEHLASVEAGIPKCVFFGLSLERPFGEIVEQVLQSPRLGHVTKNIITTAVDFEPTTVLSQPLLLIIDVGDFWCSRQDISRFRGIMIQLMKIDPVTKLVVLMDPDADHSRKMQLFMNNMKFSRVALIDIMTGQMIFVGRHLKHSRESKSKPEDLYPSTFHYFEGTNIAFRPTISHSDVRWVKDTANFLNATAFIDFSKEFDINLIVLRLSAYVGSVDAHFSTLITASTDAFIIIAPRKRLDIEQLFILPFNWEVWCLITILLFFAEAMRFFFPSMLRNDPILLAVCGYERYDLNKASRWEKMILSSLIVLMFLATNAYETKIVSLMINRPFTPEINTMEELITSGIKLQTENYDFEAASNDRRIAEIIVNSSMDHQHGAFSAYIQLRARAKFHALKYNIESGQRCIYNALQEPIQMQPKAYTVALRSPLREVLEYTHSVFVESGILDMQNDLSISLTVRRMKKNHKVEDHTDDEKDTLEFDDIVISWTILAIGLTASCGIFIGEIFVKMIAKATQRTPRNTIFHRNTVDFLQE